MKAIEKQINRGTGAGGSKTTLNGSKFENLVSCEPMLEKNNFNKTIMNKKSKDNYIYEKMEGNKKITYFKQNGFKQYMKDTFSINVYRKPDEAFLIHNIDTDIYTIKIIEKKNQNVEGSVEDKLKTGLFNKKEYSKMLNTKNNIKFNIEYAFCVSSFLQNKLNSNNIKYNIIKEIMIEDNIKLFYGEENTYFDELYKFVNE